MSAAAQKGVFPCVFANRVGVRQVIANWQAVFMARKGHSLSSSPSLSLPVPLATAILVCCGINLNYCSQEATTTAAKHLTA